MTQHYRTFQSSRAWRYLSYGIAGLVLAPVLAIFLAWLLPVTGDHWDHLSQYVLPEILWNTVCLLIGVSLLSAFLGVSLAWIVSQYQFFGRAFFQKALLFPFAIPAYVSAFVYVGLLDFAGPLRSFLRDGLWGDDWVPEIRSLPGGIVLLSLALYPYVYVLAHDAFSTQGRSLREAARSLGASPLKVFWQLALPYARPWIAGGVCLVSLELLNDFGTVTVIGISTFTTAIYKVWYGFFSPETAAQLSTFLILIAFGIYSWEQISRRRRAYSSQNPKGLQQRHRPRFFYRFLCTGFSLLIFAVAFAIPFVQVLLWANAHIAEFSNSSLLKNVWNSTLLASAVGLSTSVLAAILVMAKRYFPIPKLALTYRLAQLGYGIPGSVLAIGVFLPLVKLDHLIVDTLKRFFDYEGSLLLTGSIISMLLALSIRFLAVASSSIDSGMERVSGRLDEASTLFGVYGMAQFRRIHFPLLKRSFLSAFLLVFVDVIKEMPLTLMTRPFGWDTLSVRIYSLVSEGEWQRAAVPAALLVIVGVLPLLFFSSKRGEA